jgi:hypothetical protein
MPEKTPNTGNGVSIRKIYLTIYNLLFATLWLSILLLTLSHLPDGKQTLFNTTSPPTRWLQTAALLEVAHSAVGNFPFPISLLFPPRPLHSPRTNPLRKA